MRTIFRALVGSQAYGTAIPQSDHDYKGIYIQPNSDILGFKYKEQIEVNKDESLYEVRRFLQLAQSANPTVLELFFSPLDCIQTNSSEYSFLAAHREMFLTKECRNSFGGYAVQQIKKATALDKKMNWESARFVRKTVLDFCYIPKAGKTIPLKQYLKEEEMTQEFCGLVRLEHMRDMYAMYYDFQAQYGKVSNRPVEPIGFRGIVTEDSNDVRLSSVPKWLTEPQCLMYFNKDGWATHCRDYSQYQQWLKERNEQRYVDSQHGQKIDGKNLMHCRRLLDMALEIAETGDLKVRRPNAAYLLQIRRGEVNLVDILSKAEEDIVKLDRLYSNSSLPDRVDPDFVHELLVEIRNFK